MMSCLLEIQNHKVEIFSPRASSQDSCPPPLSANSNQTSFSISVKKPKQCSQRTSEVVQIVAILKAPGIPHHCHKRWTDYLS